MFLQKKFIIVLFMFALRWFLLNLFDDYYILKLMLLANTPGSLNIILLNDRLEKKIDRVTFIKMYDYIVSPAILGVDTKKKRQRYIIIIIMNFN